MKYISKGFQNIRGLTRSKNHCLAWQSLKNYLWASVKMPSHVPLPTEIQLEPSALCNLKCKMCTLDKNTFGDQFLSRENFQKLSSDLPLLKTFNFTGMGESLLNADLEFFIQKTKRAKVGTYLVTNGQLLSSRRIQRLIQAGLDKIAISIESAEPKVYEQIRAGASFHRLGKNLSALKKIKKRYQSKLEAGFNVTLLKENMNELNSIYKIIDLAKKFGLNFISFQNVHNVFANNTSCFFQKDKNFLAQNAGLITKYCQQNQIDVSLPSIEIKANCCYYPWVYPFITATGELLPCCIIPQFGAYQEIIEKYSWGNIFVTNFREVWNNPKAVNFRRALANKKPDQYCQQCSKYLNIL